MADSANRDRSTSNSRMRTTTIPMTDPSDHSITTRAKIGMRASTSAPISTARARGGAKCTVRAKGILESQSRPCVRETRTDMGSYAALEDRPPSEYRQSIAPKSAMGLTSREELVAVPVLGAE
jgi:hypothetical protein